MPISAVIAEPARLARLAGRRMTEAGLVVIDAQRLRSLEQNRADALDRLRTMVAAALVAVGGYGRGELFPHSDVDVLILLKQAPDDAMREKMKEAEAAGNKNFSHFGPEANLLDPGPYSCRRLVLPTPILDNEELAKIIHINDDGSFWLDQSYFDYATGLTMTNERFAEVLGGPPRKVSPSLRTCASYWMPTEFVPKMNPF